MRYLTAGESHGRGLTTILEGVPAGLPLAEEDINRDLQRRQKGFGRGDRMKIERDRAEILSGVRFGQTLGSPIALFIENRDWENWKKKMSIHTEDYNPSFASTWPRPGHADLPGVIKYNRRDVRDILERASARETASRVAAGAVAKKLLREFGIRVASHVLQIGEVRAENVSWKNIEDLEERSEASEVRCLDEDAEGRMKEAILSAKARGDTIGGIFEVVAVGVPVGLGSTMHWDRKLDARLAFALMSIQAVKGVEVGLGFRAASTLGSQMHDEIFYDEPTPSKPHGYYRKTNNAGGIEGGISNGEPIVVRAAVKPISTLLKPLRSVDIITKRAVEAAVERSDVCVVPPAAVAGEAVVAIELVNAFLEKFGGDNIDDIKRNYRSALLTACPTFPSPSSSGRGS
ncbi:MAG: chorismate synthase [bacterium]